MNIIDFEKLKAIKSRVQHSEHNTAWNVVGILLGHKFKLARVPYPVPTSKEIEETPEGGS